MRMSLLYMKGQDMTDCVDVCNIVVERLYSLGFELGDDDESHDDILEALAEVEFIRPDKQGGEGR